MPAREGSLEPISREQDTFPRVVSMGTKNKRLDPSLLDKEHTEKSRYRLRRNDTPFLWRHAPGFDKNCT